MSIFAYVGAPGSGKSYSVVEHQILPALRAGRTVVTNMPMKADLVRAEIKTNGGKEVDLRSFSIDRALADPNTLLEDCPSGCVWVVDEVYKLFPAGLQTNKVPAPFKQLLAEHRHRVDSEGNAMQVVLVCQDLSQISAFARVLVETTFRTTKLTAVGMHKRFRVDLFNGPVQGANPPIAARLREIPGKYRPDVYRYYVSHTLSESSKEGANETAIDKRANVLMRPLMIAAPFFCIIAGWWGVSHLMHRGQQLADRHDQAKAPLALATLGAAVPNTAAGGLPHTAVPLSAGGPQSGWIVKGFIINVDHPEKSLAGLQPQGGSHLLAERPYSRCIQSVEEALRCELGGVWYSTLGAAEQGGPPLRPYSSVSP